MKKKIILIIICIVLFFTSFTITYESLFDHTPYMIKLIEYWEDNNNFYIKGEKLSDGLIKTYGITYDMYQNCYVNINYSVKAYGLNRDKLYYFKMKWWDTK